MSHHRLENNGPFCSLGFHGDFDSLPLTAPTLDSVPTRKDKHMGVKVWKVAPHPSTHFVSIVSGSSLVLRFQ